MNNRFKKVMATLLTVVMSLTMLPGAVFAEAVEVLPEIAAESEILETVAEEDTKEPEDAVETAEEVELTAEATEQPLQIATQELAMLSTSSVTDTITFTTHEDFDMVFSGQELVVGWKSGNTKTAAYLVNVKLLDGDPDYGSENEAGTSLIEAEHWQTAKSIEVFVPERAAGKFLKINVMGLDANDVQTEASSYIYLYVLGEDEGFEGIFDDYVWFDESYTAAPGEEVKIRWTLEMGSSIGSGYYEVMVVNESTGEVVVDAQTQNKYYTVTCPDTDRQCFLAVTVTPYPSNGLSIGEGYTSISVQADMDSPTQNVSGLPVIDFEVVEYSWDEYDEEVYLHPMAEIVKYNGHEIVEVGFMIKEGSTWKCYVSYNIADTNWFEGEWETEGGYDIPVDEDPTLCAYLITADGTYVYSTIWNSDGEVEPTCNHPSDQLYAADEPDASIVPVYSDTGDGATHYVIYSYALICSKCGERQGTVKDAPESAATEPHSYINGICKCNAVEPEEELLPRPIPEKSELTVKRNDPVTISWSASEGAERYALIVYDEKGNAIRQDEKGNAIADIVDASSTAYTYTFEVRGKFYVQLYAQAEVVNGVAGLQSAPANILVKVECEHPTHTDQYDPEGTPIFLGYTDASHSVRNAYERVCNECGEVIDNGHFDPVNESHAFPKGDICVCGFDRNNCTHVADGEGNWQYTLFESVDKENHRPYADVYLYHCANCDSDFEQTLPREGEQRPEKHDWNDEGKCQSAGCGHVCVHEWIVYDDGETEKYSHAEFKQIKGDAVNHQQRNVNKRICSVCGFDELCYGTWTKVKHSYGSETSTYERSEDGMSCRLVTTKTCSKKGCKYTSKSVGEWVEHDFEDGKCVRCKCIATGNIAKQTEDYVLCLLGVKNGYIEDHKSGQWQAVSEVYANHDIKIYNSYDGFWAVYPEVEFGVVDKSKNEIKSDSDPQFVIRILEYNKEYAVGEYVTLKDDDTKSLGGNTRTVQLYQDEILIDEMICYVDVYKSLPDQSIELGEVVEKRANTVLAQVLMGMIVSFDIAFDTYEYGFDLGKTIDELMLYGDFYDEMAETYWVETVFQDYLLFDDSGAEVIYTVSSSLLSLFGIEGIGDVIELKAPIEYTFRGDLVESPSIKDFLSVVAEGYNLVLDAQDWEDIKYMYLGMALYKFEDSPEHGTRIMTRVGKANLKEGDLIYRITEEDIKNHRDSAEIWKLYNDEEEQCRVALYIDKESRDEERNSRGDKYGTPHFVFIYQ